LPALAERIRNELARVVPHRRFSRQTANLGMGKFLITVDRVAVKIEALLQQDAQQRIAGTRIRGEPDNGGLNARIQQHIEPIQIGPFEIKAFARPALAAALAELSRDLA